MPTDLTQSGLTWLNLQRGAFMAQTVSYRRDGAEAAIPATIGRTAYEQQDTRSGVIQRVDSRDFLIATADLADFGEPVAGDQIEEADGSVWEVRPLGAVQGEPAWRYSDQFRNTMRVHTKAVEVAAP